MDIKWLEEELKIVKQQRDNWQAMYENLKKEYEETIEAYDRLVMDTIRGENK